MTKFTPASRGDLAVTRKQTFYNNMILGAYAGYETIKVGVVKSVNVNGHVIKVGFGEACCDAKPRDWDMVYIVPKNKMDMERAVTLIGSTYDSLGDARDALREFKAA